MWRRTVRAGVVVAAAAAAFALLRAPTPLEAAQGDAAADVVHDEHWFAAQIAQAWVQLEAGTLDPSSYPLPARVATDQQATVVLAATLADGVCHFGGIIDGGSAQIMADHSGEACSPELFAQLTATLAPQATLDGSAPPAPDRVQVELARHVSDAVRFASLALSGSPSFHGWSPVPPASAQVSDDGRSVQVELAGWCATVSLDETTPQTPQPCR